MILPDVSVLVHAHNSDSPVHERALAWWDTVLAGTEGVGLAWATLLGFLRITTHRRVFARPLTVADVADRVDDWLRCPHVHIAEPSPRHWQLLRANFAATGTAGNLTTDAHLAALAVERGYVLYSTDTDFARFPGLRWENPCAR